MAHEDDLLNQRLATKTSVPNYRPHPPDQANMVQGIGGVPVAAPDPFKAFQ